MYNQYYNFIAMWVEKYQSSLHNIMAGDMQMAWFGDGGAGGIYHLLYTMCIA